MDETPRAVWQARSTDWGEAVRIDVNGLRAVVPEALRDPAADTAGRSAWAGLQNEAMLDALMAAVADRGGTLDSYAEWTACAGALYDFGDMGRRRRARFGASYRSAITSLNWAAPEAGLGAVLQATAYLPKPGKVFEQRAWTPRSLYDMESYALAAAVETTFGGMRQLFLAGVLPWTSSRVVVHADDPRRQIRLVLQTIIDVFREAGAGKVCVSRLRPYLRSPDLAPLLDEAVDDLWGEGPRPVIHTAAGMPMPEGDHVEIQAMGLWSAAEPQAGHQEVIASPVYCRRDFCAGLEVLHAGPFEGSRAVDVLAGVSGVLAGAMRGAEVCTCFAYASTEAAYTELTSSATVLPPGTLHVVPGRAASGRGGAPISAEIVAVRLPPRA